MIRFAVAGALPLAYVLALVPAAHSQPPTANGPPVVIVPPTAPEPPVEWETIKGDTKTGSDITLSIGAKAKWRLIDSNTGATLRVHADAKSATIRSDKPGPVRFVVVAENTDPRFCVVNIGGDVIPPPGPNPPDPKPPAPPSALRDRITTAYNADPSPLKSTHAKALAALYRQAANVAELPEVPTTGELIRRVKEAAGIVLKPGDLLQVRQAVAVELVVALGSEDVPLTDAHRRDSAKLFRDLAVILEAVA